MQALRVHQNPQQGVTKEIEAKDQVNPFSNLVLKGLNSKLSQQKEIDRRDGDLL